MDRMPGTDPKNDQPTQISPASPDISPSVQTPTSTTKDHLKLSLWIEIFVAILFLAGVGWVVYTRTRAMTPKATKQAVETRKAIPLIRVMQIDGDFDKTMFPPELASATGSIEIRKQVFESLVTFSEISNLVPQLAVSWTNPDSNTWVFKLRPGVKFHNGNLLTSTEVVGSIKAVLTNPDYDAFASTMQNVEAAGDLTVKITTKSPDANLLNKLAFISIYDSNAKTIDDKAGTGPYIFKAGSLMGSTTLNIVAVDSYWGGTVWTKEVDFTQEADTDKIREAIIEDKTDIGCSITALDTSKITTALPNATVVNSEALGSYGLYLNTYKKSPLQKLAVRQAIYDGLDVQKLIDAAGAPGNVATQIVSSLVPGFNPAIKPPVRDVVAAKKLLTDAGYPAGFTLEVITPKSSNVLMQTMRAQLADIGVTIKITESVPAKFFPEAYAGRYDAWVAAYSTDINDSSDVITGVFQGALYKNYYKSPALDDVMKQVNQTFDSAQRLSYLQQATKIVVDDLPFIPIRLRKYQYIVTKPYVVNVDFAEGTTLGASYWKVYSR